MFNITFNNTRTHTSISNHTKAYWLLHIAYLVIPFSRPGRVSSKTILYSITLASMALFDLMFPQKPIDCSCTWLRDCFGSRALNPALWKQINGEFMIWSTRTDLWYINNNKEPTRINIIRSITSSITSITQVSQR